MSGAPPDDEPIYGYVPSLAVSVTAISVFGLLFILHSILMVRTKNWEFGVLVLLGIACQLVGFSGRLISYYDPLGLLGFLIQICLLIVGPSFFFAALYLTLQRIIQAVQPSISPINPKKYTIFFITLDLATLVAQGVGGSIAASAFTLENANKGGNIMLSGIVIQCAILMGFYGLCIYLYRRYTPIKTTWVFKRFILALFLSSLFLFLRAIYRIAELTEGWEGHLIETEAYFYVLDSLPMFLTVFCFLFSYPELGLAEFDNKVEGNEKGDPKGNPSTETSQETLPV